MPQTATTNPSPQHQTVNITNTSTQARVARMLQHQPRCGRLTSVNQYGLHFVSNRYADAGNHQENYTLADAAGAGDLEAAKKIAENVRMMPISFWRATCSAAAEGHTEVIRTFVDKVHPSFWRLGGTSRPLRWAAKAGHRQIVELLVTVLDPNKGDFTALEEAAQEGHAAIVKMLIPVTDARKNRSHALRCAALGNHTEIIKMLIPVSDPKAAGSEAICSAARHGNIEAVAMLIPVSDTRGPGAQALSKAIARGHLEVAKMLIPVSDAKVDSSQALRWAASDGLAEMVKLLIPVSRPKTMGYWVLRDAATAGHTEVVRLLLPHVDPHAENDAALLAAANTGRAEIVKILLEEVYLPELMSGRKSLEDKESLLSRTLKAVGIRKKFDPQVIVSAFIYAAQHGHINVVDVILSAAENIPGFAPGLSASTSICPKPMLAYAQAHFDAVELKKTTALPVGHSEGESVVIAAPLDAGHSQAPAPERHPRM